MAIGVTGLRVTPRPYQDPHPPLWMTVSTDNSVSTAAEMGLKACYWQPPPARIRQRMELYAELRSKIEGRPFAIGEDQAVMRSTYVASSMEDARRDAEAGIMSSFAFNDPFRGRQVFTNPGEELDPEAKLDWDFLEPRTLLVGSPRQRDRENPGTAGGMQPRLPSGRVHPPRIVVTKDSPESGDLRHQGYSCVHMNRMKQRCFPLPGFAHAVSDGTTISDCRRTDSVSPLDDATPTPVPAMDRAFSAAG